MIYDKIVATTFGRGGRVRGEKRRASETERERGEESREPLSERFAAKNSKGFGHLSRQALAAGQRSNGRERGGRGYNPPDRLIAD